MNAISGIRHGVLAVAFDVESDPVALDVVACVSDLDFL